MEASHAEPAHSGPALPSNITVRAFPGLFLRAAAERCAPEHEYLGHAGFTAAEHRRQEAPNVKKPCSNPADGNGVDRRSRRLTGTSAFAGGAPFGGGPPSLFFFFIFFPPPRVAG